MAASDTVVGGGAPWLLVLGGLALIGVNAFALAALWYREWRWLLIVELAFVGLLVIIYAATIAAMCLALKLESPLAEGIQRAWEQVPVKKEMHTNWCPDKGGPRCKNLQDSPNWHDLSTSALSTTDMLASEDLCPWDALEIVANCSLIDPINAAGVEAGFCGAQAASNGVSQAELFHACQDCNEDCKVRFIQAIEEDLYPVSIFAFVLCGFIVVTFVWNSFVVLEHATRRDADGKTFPRPITGIWALGSYIVNGLVCAFGLILLVIGLVMVDTASDDCSQQGLTGEDSCSTSASAVAVLVLGALVSISSVLALLGVWKTATGQPSWLWVNLLRIVQIAYAGLGMLLLAAAIIFSLSSGALQSVEERYLSNWREIRAHLDEIEPEYCRYNTRGPMDGYEENERSWRSDCETRIDCLAGEREARNCAWDEKMYDAVHTAVPHPLPPPFPSTFDAHS